MTSLTNAMITRGEKSRRTSTNSTILSEQSQRYSNSVSNDRSLITLKRERSAKRRRLKTSFEKCNSKKSKSVPSALENSGIYKRSTTSI
jgi:hypothetical protein